MGMQGGLATQEATVGLPQSCMHLWEQSLGVHYTFLGFADLPTTPQLNALSGFTLDWVSALHPTFSLTPLTG